MLLNATDAAAPGTYSLHYLENQNDVRAWPVLLGRVQTFDQRAVPGMCDFICPC